MHLLFTDETNVTPSDAAKFFVYGGLIVPGESLTTLDHEIDKIRVAAGYKPCDLLKFNTATRPAHVEVTAATEAKRRILALCRDTGCKFIVHVILHKIIASQPQDQQTQWAADYVIGRFNYFLKETNDEGVCVIDNLPNGSQWSYLADKFCKGLAVDSSTVPLDRIRLFAASCIGASHAMSAVDIVLGSFRYCLNSPSNPDVARQMFRDVAGLMWHKKVGDNLYVRGRGLILRPEVEMIAVTTYRQEYDALIEHFKGLMVVNEDAA